MKSTHLWRDQFRPAARCRNPGRTPGHRRAIETMGKCGSIDQTTAPARSRRAGADRIGSTHPQSPALSHDRCYGRYRALLKSLTKLQGTTVHDVSYDHRVSLKAHGHARVRAASADDTESIWIATVPSLSDRQAPTTYEILFQSCRLS